MIWVENQFSYDEFWKRTPREIDLIFQARADYLYNQQCDKITQAYNIAGLTRANKLPTLKSLLPKKRKRPQTWREQLEIVKVLNAANGGIVKEK